MNSGRIVIGNGGGAEAGLVRCCVREERHTWCICNVACK